MLPDSIQQNPYFHADLTEQSAKEYLLSAEKGKLLFCPGSQPDTITLVYSALMERGLDVRYEQNISFAQHTSSTQLIKKRGWILFQIAIHFNGEMYAEALKVLLASYEINCNAATFNKTTLFRAAEKGQNDIVNILLATSTINCNAGDVVSGITPLFIAAEKGHTEIVNALLTMPDINYNIATRHGRMSALFIAAEKGHTEIVDALLALPDVNYNSITADGVTALMAAAARGHKKIVEALLAKPNINCNAAFYDGATALFWAAQNGHSSIVDLLLLQTNIELERPVVNSEIKFYQFVRNKDNSTQHKMGLFIQYSLLTGANCKSIAITPYQIACIMGHEKIATTLGSALNIFPNTDVSLKKTKDFVRV